MCCEGVVVIFEVIFVLVNGEVWFEFFEVGEEGFGLILV